jgi:RNA polymerase sigma-70 factor (ECF subfamily)
MGFLVTYVRDAEDAAEVFADFSEQLWKSLPRFEWRCSARTWAYMLARRAARHYRRRERKHDAVKPLTQLSRLSAAVERVRTGTIAFQRTEVKDRFQELRLQLDPEDQTLLVLRVDRDLSWLELARIMLGDEPSPNEQALKTEAARLRKRFQYAKERLRVLVEKAGLLET